MSSAHATSASTSNAENTSAVVVILAIAYTLVLAFGVVGVASAMPSATIPATVLAGGGSICGWYAVAAD